MTAAPERDAAVCPKCGGTGNQSEHVMLSPLNVIGVGIVYVECHRCDGTGYVDGPILEEDPQ